MEETARRISAIGLRSRFYREPDEVADGAGQVRELDRAAKSRHRQQAGRLRIREDRVRWSSGACPGHPSLAPSAACAQVLFPQLEPLQLAGGCARQRCPWFDPAWKRPGARF